MRGNRLRWGALAWILTLQFFVVETIAQLAQTTPYSRIDDVISDLGATTSPARALMNASFVVQGALILAGVVLLLPALRGTAARAAQGLLTVSAVGVVLVGVFPEDGTSAMHTIGAILHLGAGTVGLVALAYAVRRYSELIGSVLAVLGVVGIAASLLFLDAVTEYLGRGGTERLAAYPIPVGLALAGATLWRLSDAGGRLPELGAAGPSRRELREQAHAERAAQARERDAALEAAAARHAEDPVAARPGATAIDPAGAPDAEDDDFDPDDPWAPRRRRD